LTPGTAVISTKSNEIQLASLQRCLLGHGLDLEEVLILEVKGHQKIRHYALFVSETLAANRKRPAVGISESNGLRTDIAYDFRFLFLNVL
jgi:hypothetical protein